MKQKKRNIIISLFILLIFIFIAIAVLLSIRYIKKHSTLSNALSSINTYAFENTDSKIYLDDTLYNEYKYHSEKKGGKKSFSDNLFYTLDSSDLLADNALYATVDKACLDTILASSLNPSDDIWYEEIFTLSENGEDFLSVYDCERYSFSDEYAISHNNSLFLSEYATNAFSGDYFEHFTGESLFFPKYNLNVEKMANCLESAFAINDEINTVWILIDPFNTEYSLTEKDTNTQLNNLCNLFKMHNDTHFNVFLYSPSSYVWNDELNRIDDIIESYQAVILKLSELSNTTISFPGYKEWWLANKALFASPTMDEDTIINLIANWIAGNNLVDSNSLPEITESLKSHCEKYRNTVYDDLSDYKIVFFGDSIIGNYHDVTGISALTSSLCSIKTVNKAVGGTNATHQFVPEVINYFKETTEKSDFYLINFGFNDYSQFLPLDGPESYNQGLTDGISEIRKNDPDAKIIIAAPFYSFYELTSEEKLMIAGSLNDFANECEKIAHENECYFINFYSELDFEAKENAASYFEDQVHLNEYGRLLYTQILVTYLEHLVRNE